MTEETQTKTIEYVFKLTDNVSEEAADISASSKQAGSDLRAMGEEADNANKKLNDTQVNAVMIGATLSQLRSGVSAVTSGLTNMGIVSDETAEKFQYLNASIALLTGAVQIFKSVQSALTALNAVNAVGASIDAVRSVLQNPLAIGAIGPAAGAGLGVAAMFMVNNGGSSSNTTNITVQDTTPREATSDIVRIVDGGAL